ncbi:MAG: SemiSWEET transporter [Alphaproteobacteria bacterium]|nr:SemiSWEET transporter [Alphaproteobacteria bacterium]
MLDFIHPDVVGGVAAVLTTIAFLPQVIKSWRSGSTRDVSLGMFLILNTGIVLWLIYGLLLGSLPLILANTVTIFLTGTIMVLKLRTGRS